MGRSTVIVRGKEAWGEQCLLHMTGVSQLRAYLYKTYKNQASQHSSMGVGGIHKPPPPTEELLTVDGY